MAKSSEGTLRAEGGYVGGEEEDNFDDEEDDIGGE